MFSITPSPAMPQVADQQCLFTCSFASGRAVLAFHSQSSPSAWQVGNCCLITGIVYAIGISCRDGQCSSGVSFGFSSCSMPSYILSYIFVKHLLLIIIKTSMAERKERDLLHFSMARTKMDSILLVIEFCSFYILLMYSLDSLSVISPFVGKDPWISFSSLPISTWKLWIHKNMWAEHLNKHPFFYC